MLAYFIPPAGKESIIPIMMALLKKAGCNQIESLILPILLIFITDVISSSFVILNFDLLKFIPKIGSIIRKFGEKARDIITKYEIERNVYFSLFIFVFIPFQGTGSTTASIIGKLLNLDSFKLFVTIAFGSFSSAVFIAVISAYLSQCFRNIFLSTVLAILVVILLGIVLKIRISR